MPMAKTVFITGINGFIGRALEKRLSAAGYRVLGSTSKSSSNSHLTQIRLGEMVNANLFSGVDVIVHAAYDARSNQVENNVQGTIQISEAAVKAGVTHEIFISSYSALTDAKSEYAEAKKLLETFFRSRSATIVRPGLVIGLGGLFMRMIQLVKRYPLLPLLDGGKGAMPVLWIDDLTDAIEFLIAHKLVGEFNLFHHERLTLIALLDASRKQMGLRRWFVPIPSSWLLPPLRFAEFLRIPLSVNSQNVAGYRVNQNHDAPSDLRQLIGRETDVLQASLSLSYAAGT
jgi:nucleoside-diphosphate-sugar epimerase